MPKVFDNDNSKTKEKLNALKFLVLKHFKQIKFILKLKN